MWLVMEQNFCTSLSLAVAMMASGFSWASTTLVCSDEYTSAKLMVAGEASNALNMETQKGLGGMRIFMPFRSSGLVMARVLEVIWR